MLEESATAEEEAEEWNKTKYFNIYMQGQIYICEGPRVVKMWRPLSVATNLGYDIFFLFVIISKNGN
jgi:hypothetical protein